MQYPSSVRAFSRHKPHGVPPLSHQSISTYSATLSDIGFRPMHSQSRRGLPARSCRTAMQSAIQQSPTGHDASTQLGPDQPSTTSASRLRTPLAALIAASLSLATSDNAGAYSPVAICWLLLAFAAAICLVLLHLPPPRATPARIPVNSVLLLCILSQFVAQFWGALDASTYLLGSATRNLILLLAAAAVISGSLCADRSWLGKWAFPVLVVIQLAVGLLIIGALPVPTVDVRMFQEIASHELLRGHNPYALAFRDPYLPEASARFFGPGVSVNGVLQFGYPYMPLLLFTPLPGYLLGDVRYANLLAAVAAGCLIAAARPGPLGRAGALLIMFSSIAPLMILISWTETYVLLWLALTWFCYCRNSAFTPYAFGLLLVSKQYMPALAPLGLLLVRCPWAWSNVVHFSVKAVLAGSLVTLPFVLWNPEAFYRSVVQLEFRQPFRPDALSLLVWLQPSDPAKWLWVPFALFGLMVAFGVWAGMKRRMSFPLAMGLSLFVFFALNKQAFANYYYVVIAAFCCCVAGEHPSSVENRSLHRGEYASSSNSTGCATRTANPRSLKPA
jgi:hypothetical protein